MGKKKIYYFISLDYETDFITSSLEELKEEIRVKHWDDDALPFMVQIPEDKELRTRFDGSLYVSDEYSDKNFEPASEVLSEDDYCLLDKGYILKNN